MAGKDVPEGSIDDISQEKEAHILALLHANSVEARFQMLGTMLESLASSHKELADCQYYLKRHALKAENTAEAFANMLAVEQEVNRELVERERERTDKEDAEKKEKEEKEKEEKEKEPKEKKKKKKKGGGSGK